MKTAAEFQARLQKLQREQTELALSPDRLKKTVRARSREITAEYFAVKKEWRETLGETVI